MTSTPAAPLHPQAAAHLDAIRGTPTVAEMTVAQARAAMAGYLMLQRPAPRLAQVENRYIPAPRSDLPIRILRPTLTAQAGPVVVVLHGSGWVAANLDHVDEPARVLAIDTGFAVITVNYQKAPEHPFPAPLEDCLAAVRWVHANAESIGVDPTRIAVVGDSAGGNLAAAVALALGESQLDKAQHRTTKHGGSQLAEAHPAEPQFGGSPVHLAALALLYPALDARRNTDSYRAYGTGFGLDAADMAWFWGHYLGDADGESPLVSPSRAPRLAAMPPTFVATAANDVLRDEAEIFATQLKQDGIPVRAKRYDGMIHGFWWMDGMLDGARELQLDLAAYLSTQLGDPQRPLRKAK